MPFPSMRDASDNILGNYTEKVVEIAVTDNDFAIDPRNGPVQFLKILKTGAKLGFAKNLNPSEHISIVLYVDCNGNTPTWDGLGGPPKYMTATGTAPTLVTTAGKLNVLTVTYDWRNGTWLLFQAGKET